MLYIIMELIGAIPTPLKNMSSSDWVIIPTIGGNQSHVPNHQPVVNGLILDMFISFLCQSKSMYPERWTNPRKAALYNHRCRC
jgi:hypothetical protein